LTVPDDGSPIDPRADAYGLEGHVVTMDDSFTELDRGVVYISAGEIASVAPTDAPPPQGFEGAPIINSGGTIFPGLIELHNHLTYDALPLWSVPQRFANRDRWSGGAMQQTYRRNISGPMTVLGRTPGLVEAVVRYVEAKCLLGGVTTSQGIALFSNQGAQTFFQGVVRNVETSKIDGMPPALTRISDVEASDATAFLHRLQASSCLLLHLAEGTDEAAHEHFAALQISGDDWAITEALAGIHCVALERTDFDVLAERGASMIWSPLSNLLLYGETAKVDQAKTAGLTIGLGSDWSPSGSKNLLGELKVARLFDAERAVFPKDRELVSLATRDAARVLRWETKLGSLEQGKRADLLILTGRAGDPYDRLLGARETTIRMVAIDGIPRCGSTDLMGRFHLGADTEHLDVDGSSRILHLADPQANAVIESLSLAEATDRLRDALARLPELALQLEEPSMDLARQLGTATEPRWMLLLDHDEPFGLDQRPHLPDPGGSPTAELTPDLALAQPLSELLEPIDLDPITVADDPRFLDRVGEEMNLPVAIQKGLPELY
jgi:5-methylthioadenosine/S-adenosylhomocysteine deaminase